MASTMLPLVNRAACTALSLFQGMSFVEVVSLRKLGTEAEDEYSLARKMGSGLSNGD
jgi:hypothetical protein